MQSLVDSHARLRIELTGLFCQHRSACDRRHVMVLGHRFVEPRAHYKSIPAQSLSRFLPAQPCQQVRDVMGQGAVSYAVV